MKVNEMSIAARNSRAKSYLKLTNFSEKERQAALFADLTISLSEVLVASQGENQDILLDKYCQTAGRFLLVASSQNVMDRFLISDEQIAQIQNKWQTKSYNVMYLILEQQVQNAYFKHQVDDLVHAWHMFLKLGLVDLNLSESTIEKHFFKAYEIEPL
ncbi:hypothetical protein LPAF129_00340 [Ligilactobacillus pabuli]|uniref:dUTPase n=1 Tax=Ligilactobacillus pabuli TaxID=2886039 RepID=A0ABQ5JE58_9LACO|nr:hypothetical protein [Ligilactobacillus pabuli]GKS80349.1 hypothetical protein LPAF129_00340 [Ligilactobacillus pabuli]HIW89590.1 hypothetical protein [Candidatus Ligilactobacillus excrementipullorum]